MSLAISTFLCISTYFSVVLSLSPTGVNVQSYTVSKKIKTSTSCNLFWRCTKYRTGYVKALRCAPGYQSRDGHGCSFEDEKPVFTNCPIQKITTTDRKFNLTLTATDNSGQVTLKQVQGPPICSLLDYGMHFSKYVATDASGNSASCAFTVEIKDTVKPRFTKCPIQKITTTDRLFKWTVSATDNSQQVILKRVQGLPPGSLLDYGVHFIKYVATDASGNMATCAFVVDMKASNCPRPTSNDTDVMFTCSGLTAQSYCQISCESGSSVEGSKYIACVRDKSQNNTSYWEPVHGLMGTCSKRPCPPLNTPINGALACDKQLGGTFCQIQCNHNYDIPFSEQRSHTFVCWDTSDAWYPQSTAPDCLELSLPDEYYLPTDFYYYTGDCSEPQALNDIKQQFIDNLNSIGISPCMTDICSVDDIEVDCGDTAEPNDCQFRRRRSSNQAKRYLHVRVKFHVKNTNRTLSPAAADALLKYLDVKSKKRISTNTTIRTMLSKALTPKVTGAQATGKPTVVPPVVVKEIKAKSGAEKMSVKCKAGYTQTEAGACIPCSVGSYSDVKSNTCKSCPVTSYQDEPAMSSCKSCPSHHMSLSPGATNRDQCLKQCGPDTFSLTGLIPCFPCPDGRYQPRNGSTTCQVSPESEVAVRVVEKYLQQ